MDELPSPRQQHSRSTAAAQQSRQWDVQKGTKQLLGKAGLRDSLACRRR